MSSLSDFFKKNADVLGNDIFGKIGEAVGLPSLPPLQFSEPYTNNNNYVESRPAPTQLQPEVTPPASRDWIMYGAMGLGVIVVIGLLMRK